MGDSSASKKAGIPSWQRAFTEQAKSQPETPAEPPKEEPATTQDSVSLVPEESMTEQAVRFLKEASITSASLDQKVSFLESKGVKRDDIDRAIALVEAERVPSQASSTTAASPPPTQHVTQPFPQPQTQPPPLPQRDAPPIITYPEFLMHSNKPPPIITVSRLLNTAYIASGVAAVIYGASKYLITPMSETLTDARHDFALHTQGRIEELNARIGNAVSKDPLTNPSAKPLAAIVREIHDDGASETGTTVSDPTELFHRDHGTQTSADLEASSLLAHDDTSSSSDDASISHDGDPIAQQTYKLKQLHRLCADLVEDSNSNGSTADDISTHVDALKTYVEDLHYPQHLWTGSHYNAFGGDSKKEDDEIARVKAEIRGVKGFFLSARNFPGTAPAARSRPPVGSYG